MNPLASSGFGGARSRARRNREASRRLAAAEPLLLVEVSVHVPAERPDCIFDVPLKDGLALYARVELFVASPDDIALAVMASDAWDSYLEARKPEVAIRSRVLAELPAAPAADELARWVGRERLDRVALMDWGNEMGAEVDGESLRALVERAGHWNAFVLEARNRLGISSWPFALKAF